MATFSTGAVTVEETPSKNKNPGRTIGNGSLTKLGPYAELARVGKPLAILYLYFPCLFGTLLAASTSDPPTPPRELLRTNLILVLGCFLVRCAGCTWNDIVDQDVDRQVARTRHRPLARRAVSTSSAILSTIAQVVFGLLLVKLLLPQPCLYYSIPSILLTGLYPYGKRFTFYPQIILGSVFSWGVVLAFPAMGMDITAKDSTMMAVASLYVSCIAWTMSYDTIYSAQDRKDDVRAKVKSPVVRHQDHTRAILSLAITTQLLLLIGTGIAINAHLMYYLLTVLGTSTVLITEVTTVNLENPKECLWWFQKGCWCTGVVLSAGLVEEYLIRLESKTA